MIKGLGDLTTSYFEQSLNKFNIPTFGQEMAALQNIEDQYGLPLKIGAFHFKTHQQVNLALGATLVLIAHGLPPLCKKIGNCCAQGFDKLQKSIHPFKQKHIVTEVLAMGAKSALVITESLIKALEFLLSELQLLKVFFSTLQTCTEMLFFNNLCDYFGWFPPARQDRTIGE